MKKLLVLSGKGGTGKTTIAAALIGFANAKAFADCDVDAPNLHLVVHMDTQPEHTRYDGSPKATIQPEKCVNCGLCMQNCRFEAIRVVDGQYSINEHACEGCGVCVYVCPNQAVKMEDDIAGMLTLYGGERVFSTATLRMGRGNSGKLVTAVKVAMADAAPDTAFAIIDGSPGVGCPVIASMSGVDLVLIVAEPSLSGFSDMQRILKTAEIFGVRTVVCVNKFDTSLSNTELIEQYCNANNIPCVGRIPYDRQVSKAINEGIGLASVTCPAHDALQKVYTATISYL